MSRNQCLLRYGRVFYEFGYGEGRKKIPEAFCEELQLLTVLVFALPGEFSTNSHFAYTTSSECKPSLLMTFAQEWRFANAFSQNAS
jgi:hypothetical protein